MGRSRTPRFWFDLILRHDRSPGLIDDKLGHHSFVMFLLSGYPRTIRSKLFLFVLLRFQYQIPPFGKSLSLRRRDTPICKCDAMKGRETTGEPGGLLVLPPHAEHSAWNFGWKPLLKC